MNVVNIHNVNYHIDNVPILQDLTLNLREGEVLGLFGHNGAGKTTCMKLILGLLEPSAGKIEVFHCQPKTVNIRRQIGFLPENITFYQQLTGRETLAHFARLRGAAPLQVSQLLEQVGLALAADRRVKTYSKGMRQRLGLAQALLGTPKLLLLDEPTVGLDPIATKELYLLIDRLRQGGTSVILCTHSLAGVEMYLDRAAILADGRLQAVGDLAQLRASAGLPVRICIRGLANASDWIHRWHLLGQTSARLLDKQDLEVVTTNENKLTLLKEVLEEAQPSDIEVLQPSLEDLYCHFMSQVYRDNKEEVLP